MKYPKNTFPTRPELLGTLSTHASAAFASSAQRIVVCPTKPSSLPWSGKLTSDWLT